MMVWLLMNWAVAICLVLVGVLCFAIILKSAINHVLRNRQ